MTETYQTLQELHGVEELRRLAEDQDTANRLRKETSAIRAAVWMTISGNENGALSELRLLAEVAERLHGQLGHDLHSFDLVENFLAAEFFAPVVTMLLKAKNYHEKQVIRTVDAILGSLVRWAALLAASARPHLVALLALIIDRNAEFYRAYGKELLSTHPFGERREPDPAVAAFVDGLGEGQAIDCVKSVGGRKSWSRATVISCEGGYLKVRFFGEALDSYVQQKYFEVAPPNTRTHDFAWREKLAPGDRLDYVGSSYRGKWALHEVVEARPNGTVLVGEVGSGQEPEAVRVHSPAIAPPETRSSKMSVGFDDFDDEIFLAAETVPRFAIIRQYHNYTATSAFLVKYINFFCQAGGLDVLLTALEGEAVGETAICWLRLLHSMVDNLVAPVLATHGQRAFTATQQLVVGSAEKSLRGLSEDTLSLACELVSQLAGRIFPRPAAQREIDLFSFRIAILCVLSEFLQKQLFGAKLLDSVETRLRDDSSAPRRALVDELLRGGVFEKVIRGHPSLVARCGGVIRLLLAEEAIGRPHWELLWTEMQKTDPETKKALTALVQDVVPELSASHTAFFLNKLIECVDVVQEAEVDLLLAIRRFALTGGLPIVETKHLTDHAIWALVQHPTEHKKELVKVLVSSFVEHIGDERKMYLVKIIEQIKRRKMVVRNLELMALMLEADGVSLQLTELLEEERAIEVVVDELIAFLHEQASGEDRQLQPRLAFLNNLLANSPKLFPLEIFLKVWHAAFCLPTAGKCFIDWLEWTMRHFPARDLRRLWSDHIGLLESSARPDLLPLVLQLFVIMNVEEGFVCDLMSHSDDITHRPLNLRAPLNHLHGFADLWSLLTVTRSKEVTKSLCDFLARLVCSQEADVGLGGEQVGQAHCAEELFDTCVQLISQGGAEVAKAAVLLEAILQNCEPDGPGELRTFASLHLGEKVTIFLENGTTYLKDRGAVTMRETSLVQDIFDHAAAEVKLPHQTITLSGTQGQLTSKQRSLTLGRVGLHSGDVLVVGTISVQREVPLLTPKDEFTPRALAVFKEIFADFSEDGRMWPHHLALFTCQATKADSCDPKDERVTDVFFRHDRGRKGYLVEEEFLRFFLQCTQASKNKFQTVRRNLYNLGYQLDLLTKRKVGLRFAKEENSLRRRLAANAAFNRRLLGIVESLSGDEAQAEVRNCLLSLVELIPPSLSLLEEVVSRPVETLTRMATAPFHLLYCSVLACSAAQDPLSALRMLQHHQPEATASLLAEMGLKLLNFGLFEILLADMKRLATPYCFRLVAVVFVAGVGAKHPAFPFTVHRFASYFAQTCLRQPKKADETQDDAGEFWRPLLASQWQTFCDQVNFAKFNDILLARFEDLVGGIDFGKAEKAVVGSFMTLVCGSFLMNPPSFRPILARQGKLTRLMLQAVQHDSLLLRFHAKSLFVFLFTHTHDAELRSGLLGALIGVLREGQGRRMQAVMEAAGHLLLQAAEARFDPGVVLTGLFAELVQRIFYAVRKGESLEGENSDLKVSLNFLEKLLSSSPSVVNEVISEARVAFARFLFHECLFPMDEENLRLGDALLSSPKAREAVLELLGALCSADADCAFAVVASGFGPLGQLLPTLSRDVLSADTYRKPDHGFVGIKNPGCVCYMNAMLQQFYCTPPFRYGLLMADDGQPEDFHTMRGRLFDDNLFHQLQHMFTFLDASHRLAYSPLDFCFAYKDMSGEPTDLLMQQDAQEFLNVVFDRLERALKPTPFKGILESVFGGTTINRFTCSKCGFVREKQELFYNLSLEVKNCANITESFDRLVREEAISDYHCSNCEQRCDVTKQCLLHQLPNVLIVHLQKIVFDLEFCVNVKISSKYEFPMEVNLRQYSDNADAQPPDDFTYRLVGAVVHRGNAESGHYTSLINVNRRDPARPDPGGDLWLEFDDAKVSRFDMSGFGDECFGAESEEAFPLATNCSKSAYILVYDKLRKGPIRLAFTEENISEKEKIVARLRDPAAFAFDQQKLIFETDFYNIGVYAPPASMTNIRDDNTTLQLEQQVLGPAFLGCLARAAANVPLDTEGAQALITHLPAYVSDVLACTLQTREAKAIVRRLEEALRAAPHHLLPFAVSYVFSPRTGILKTVASAASPQFCSYLAKFAAKIVIALAERNSLATLKPCEVSSEALQAFGLREGECNLSATERRSAEAEVATVLICKLGENFTTFVADLTAANFTHRLLYAFKMLNFLTEQYPAFADLLLNQGNILALAHLFYTSEYTHPTGPPKLSAALLRLQATLIGRVKSRFALAPTQTIYYTQSPPRWVLESLIEEAGEGAGPAERIAHAYSYFCREQFFDHIVKEKEGSRAIERIVKALAAGDRTMTDCWASFLIKCVSQEAVAPGIPTALASLLQIDDQLREYRRNRLLGVPRVECVNTKESFAFEADMSGSRGPMHSYPTLFFDERGLMHYLTSHRVSNNISLLSVVCQCVARSPELLARVVGLPLLSQGQHLHVHDFWIQTLRSQSESTDENATLHERAQKAADEFGKAASELIANGGSMLLTSMVSEWKSKGKIVNSRLWLRHFAVGEGSQSAGIEVFVDSFNLGRESSFDHLSHSAPSEEPNGARPAWVVALDQGSSQPARKVTEDVHDTANRDQLIRVQAFNSLDVCVLFKLEVAVARSGQTETYNVIGKLASKVVMTFEKASPGEETEKFCFSGAFLQENPRGFHSYDDPRFPQLSPLGVVEL